MVTVFRLCSRSDISSACLSPLVCTVPQKNHIRKVLRNVSTLLFTDHTALLTFVVPHKGQFTVELEGLRNQGSACKNYMEDR